jgi:single-stranded DNA-binding protein
LRHTGWHTGSAHRFCSCSGPIIYDHDTDGGGKFLAISLAVNEGFKRADGTFGRKQTQWHQVVSFSKTKAQLVADSVSLGDLVEIQGELRGRVIEIGERKITTRQVVLTEITRIAGKALGEEVAA